MALKIERTITLGDGRQITGDYWSIKSHQINKRTNNVGILLGLWVNEAAYNAGAEDIFSMLVSYTDVVFDYAQMDAQGINEKTVLYNAIKADQSRGFQQAENI